MLVYYKLYLNPLVVHLFVRAEVKRGATSRAEAAEPVNDRAQDVVDAALARADAAAADAVPARAEAAAARRATAHAAESPSCLDHAPARGCMVAMQSCSCTSLCVSYAPYVPYVP